MSTLYEILEVSEKASKEVIEKAYRVLAKKYHPDLQLPENQTMAETKMKQINEAYDILSNDEKRKQYDVELRIRRQEEQNIRKQQEIKQQADIKNTSYQQQMTNEEKRYQELQRRKYEDELREYQEQRKRQMDEQYQNAYYDYLRSLGYKIKEKWTWNKTKQLLLAIAIMIAIGCILWFIPPTHDIMVNLYENNIFIKITVNTIAAVFQGIGTTLQNLFTH
ncbi:MAG: DnaJ domain-containing protein [Clostridia bacterium]|nr:DnaJ domain-containing protein [Clostridia bacterium]